MAIRDLMRPQGRGNRPSNRRRESGDPLEAFHQEMDRLLDSFFGREAGDLEPFHGRFGDASGDFAPSVDVQEKGKEFVVKAELPGMDEENVDIQVDNNDLVLRGEKEDREEKQEGSVYTTECSYGSFVRRIPLPAEVDSENASAKFKKGVLDIRLPKIKQVADEGKRIEIERE
mgnify:CR=1 FL=1